MTGDEDEADRAARLHPVIDRLVRDPQYVTDPGYRLGADHLRLFLAGLLRALDAEQVDADLRRRLVNRMLYGEPEGPTVVRRPAPRLRSAMGENGKPADGLGPYLPGDVIREDVRVTFDRASARTPDERALLAHAEDRISMLTDPGKAWESMLRRLDSGVDSGDESGRALHGPPVDDRRHMRVSRTRSGRHRPYCDCGWSGRAERTQGAAVAAFISHMCLAPPSV